MGLFSSFFHPSSLLEIKKSPVDGIPIIPGGTIYGGHLHLLQEHDFQIALYNWSIKYADKHGRCTFYMGPTTPSISVTNVNDVQIVLKTTSYRYIVPIMTKHFIQLFGTNNIGILNGYEWKKQRLRIIKALHSSHVIQYNQIAFHRTTQKFINHIITQQIDNNNNNNNNSDNDDDNDNDACYECSDILQLMKALTMDCFGQAAVHTDFGTCQSFFHNNNDNIHDNNDNINSNNDNDTESFSSNNNNNNNNRIGYSFDILTSELMRRITKDILYPTSHSYSIPTKANHLYAQEKEYILSFVKQLVQDRRRHRNMKKQQQQQQTMKINNNQEQEQDDEEILELPADLLTGFLEHFEQQQQQQRQQQQQQQQQNTEHNESTNINSEMQQEEDDDTCTMDEEELVQLISQSIMALLFAGYETSSVTLTYCLYLLSQHSNVLRNCLQEIQKVNNANNSNDESTISAKTTNTSASAAASASSSPSTTPYIYLHAVLKETLRLYPPAISTTRTADRDIELPSSPGRRTNGDDDDDDDEEEKIIIPKGTYLYIPIWIVQRDERHFTKPLEFLPERWVQYDTTNECWINKATTQSSNNDDNNSNTTTTNKNENNNNICNHNAWIPFSAGARACPGQHFAIQEMITILSILLPALSFEPPKDYVLTPHRDGFVQIPKGGIPMTIQKRNK